MSHSCDIDDEKLINISKDIFMKYGIKKTEMKAISQYARIGRSSLYRHFRSKEDIAFYVAKEIISELTYPLFCDSKIIGTGFECLQRMLQDFVDNLVSHPKEIKFLDEFDQCFSDDYPASKASNEYTQFNKRTSPYVKKYIIQGQEDGTIKKEIDPIFYEKLINNVLFGVAQRIIPREKHFHVEQGFGKEFVLSSLTLLLSAIKI